MSSSETPEVPHEIGGPPSVSAGDALEGERNGRRDTRVEMIDSRSAVIATTSSRRSIRSSLVRLLTLLIVLAGIRFVVPVFVEEMQYRLTRGKQRAQYEVAGSALQSLKLHELSLAYQLLSHRVGPTVVHVDTSDDMQVARRARNDKQRQRTPSDETDSEGNGSFVVVPREQGSGVIVDSSGYVITNFHVVANANAIQVTLSDGRRVDAELIGHDLLTDVAVLKVEATDLVAAQWGDSNELQEGALVWAFGSPFGLKRSMTAGIVSATSLAGVAGNVYQDYIQTDAAVNPGSSGGPLVSVDGRVVGINTAILGDSYRGISFAVPSNIARRIYDQIRREGRVERGWLGVQLRDVPSELAKTAGFKVSHGALVNSVGPFGAVHSVSPAADAGIQQGDVIVSWNGKDVDRKETLMRRVGQTDIGSRVDVEVIREGERLNFEVTVGRRRTGF